MATPPEPPSGETHPTSRDAKRDLRRRLLEARRGRSVADLGRTAAVIADHALAWEPVRRARTVAAYVSVGAEPGTGPLLEGLHAAGVRVLLPVVLPDLDLDWAAYTGPESLAAARLGLLEPTGALLGVDAVRDADVLLVPGLAVSPSGERLGRGGGCYDRALARAAGRPVAVLLHDDEVGVDVPTEPHDRPVTHAITPAGVHALGAR
ncbi:5-formyltetrahydrofolate cyclo-ligase [Nocardioides sp. Soil777]|uniref:5-formyltetrahydrofolate cyclo-ligase n=1 Tax=Nocardioides sp. Soil777 TaxID=1736409 RepID=UPI0009E8C351|nr:5-formyltetrahydrofolate cyclo-ligase [Nocardioides sp. Soil777]